MKTNRRILLSSALCLIPLAVSALLYRKLPEQMPIHWNSSGEPDGFLPKQFGAWAVPAFLLLVHLTVSIQTEKRLQKNQISSVSKLLCFWAVPAASVLIVPACLFAAAGYPAGIRQAALAFTGVLIIIAGNHLPKNRPNSIAGYRLPWTFQDADNWNKTHRFAGKIWVTAGFVLLFLALTGLGRHVFLIPLSLTALLLPAVYGFFLDHFKS